MQTFKFTAAAFAFALLSGTALAESTGGDLQQEYNSMRNDPAAVQSEPVSAAQPATQYNNNGVQMISGGVGDAGLDNISALQNHYDVKLVFAETSGAYLADVGVEVKDHAGNVVASTNSDGPILLMKLKPGNYTISSTSAGAVKDQKIHVADRGLKTYIIHFPSSES